VFELERQVKLLPSAPALPKGAAGGVSAFVGDGSCAGDGGWMLQKLWEAVGDGAWAKVPGQVGVFQHVGEEASELLARAGWPASMKGSRVDVKEHLQEIVKMEAGEAQLARFPDGGGLLSMRGPAGGPGFEHRLMTESACKAALL
jgi:hypothetical protein